MIILGVSAPAAHAVNRFWEGNSSGTWNSNANWTNSTTTLNSGSVVPLATDDVFFHMTGALGGDGQAMNLAGNQVAGSITFRQSQNFTIGANSSTNTGAKSLTIGAGGITKTSTSGSVTIRGNNTNGVVNVNLATSASQTWTNASTTTSFNLATIAIGTATTASATIGLGANTLTLDGDGNFNFGAATTTNAVITGSTGSLIKNGAGTVTIGGVNTYGGSTTISGGKLALVGTGSVASSSRIIVGASTTFDVSGVTGGYTLGASQTLSGSGTVTGAMTVSGTLSPGNSPGILTTGSQTWANGADYNFQMLDATGTAGTGYDQIAITGTLNLSDPTAGGFGINIWSLSSTGPDVSGNALNFDNSIDQSWTILTTTEGITGFDAGDFLINLNARNGTNGFSNALEGGVFSLSATPNNLILNYTAVPEPNAALLGSLSILALLRRRR